MQIIDAHHHLWDLSKFPYKWLAPETPPRRFGDHTAIKCDYLPADYRADFAGHTLAGSVHVQANSGAADPVEETAWLQDLSDNTGCPTAIVAEMDLCRDDIARQIARHAAFRALRGARAMIAWDKAGRWSFGDRPGIMAEPGFVTGARALAAAGLSLDLVIAPDQLGEVADLSRAAPDLSIVINHMAQLEPDVPGCEEAWRAGLAKIADCPSVFLKVSGLWTIDLTWRPDRLKPYVHHVFDTLGADRLMYGSNLPVEKVNTSAERQLRVLTEILRDTTEKDRQDFFFNTAKRVYRL